MGFDNRAALTWYRRNRERSRALFGMLADEVYYTRPILLRHPIVFYEGHLPAFSFNTLVKRALGRPGIDPGLETLFARGIDPHEASAGKDGAAWPSRDVVRQFVAEADAQVMAVLATEELDRPGDALLDRGEAVFSILEHEAMHQETLLYMCHRLPFADKRRPAEYTVHIDGRPVAQEWREVAPGRASLGVDRSAVAFGWDNEFPACAADVPAFEIERHDVTNARFLEFVEAGGYRNRAWWTPEDWDWVVAEQIAHPIFWVQRGREWYWRGMFEALPLPMAWPVYVSHAEAAAFARWSGTRLPSEAEYQRAAFGSDDGERPHPWGVAEPDTPHGVFDFTSWDPQPAGSHPSGASAWGVDDLVGNGWEWTSTEFRPFPGFAPMASYPEYSADFFDGEHYVMKGASPATARELLRPTFRNWFRGRYPYVYATFRCVR
jgi:gamma-glutamyl hercynylcysteine S-oxide synthase